MLFFGLPFLVENNPRTDLNPVLGDFGIFCFCGVTKLLMFDIVAIDITESIDVNDASESYLRAELVSGLVYH